jgi:hypothetical protein
MKITAS